MLTIAPLFIKIVDASDKETNIANLAESSDIRSLIGVISLRVALLLAVAVRPPAYLIKSNNESLSFNS